MKPDSLNAKELRRIADLMDSLEVVYSGPPTAPGVEFPTMTGFKVFVSAIDGEDEDPLIAGWINLGEHGMEFFPNVD